MLLSDPIWNHYSAFLQLSRKDWRWCLPKRHDKMAIARFERLIFAVIGSGSISYIALTANKQSERLPGKQNITN